MFNVLCVCTQAVSWASVPLLFGRLTYCTETNQHCRTVPASNPTRFHSPLVGSFIEHKTYLQRNMKITYCQEEDSEEENSNKSSSMGVGGCPVQYSNTTTTSSSYLSWSTLSRLNPWRASKTSPNTLETKEAKDTKNRPSGCPVQTNASPTTTSTKSNPFYAPASIEESAQHAQSPHPTQRHPLSTHRMISSIPRAVPSSPTEQVPHHQPTTNKNNNKNTNTGGCTDESKEAHWVYPSEQQFYNAMKRKGWELPPDSELTVPHVIQIHNAVNERGWRHILEWETLRGNPNPQLVRFLGRPKDTSPRAFINTWLKMREAPFDRHDWYVVNGNDPERNERRYVIDFYNGASSPSASEHSVMGSAIRPGSGRRDARPSMYLDVRPALDDVEAVQDRVRMFVRDAFPGIYSVWNNYQKQSLLMNSNNDKGNRKGQESHGSGTGTSTN